MLPRKGSAMTDKKNPKQVLKTRTTEEGVQELTLAGKKGYSYLRHCVGILKKYDSVAFEDYCELKDNKNEVGEKNKTAESRKAAYTFASRKAPANATESLVKHARALLKVVCTESHEKVEAVSHNQGPKPGDLMALKLAGQIAAEGYNRSFRDEQAPHYDPSLDSGEPVEQFSCDECGEVYLNEDGAEECCEDCDDGDDY